MHSSRDARASAPGATRLFETLMGSTSPQFAVLYVSVNRFAVAPAVGYVRETRWGIAYKGACWPESCGRVAAIDRPAGSGCPGPLWRHSSSGTADPVLIAWKLPANGCEPVRPAFR